MVTYALAFQRYIQLLRMSITQEMGNIYIEPFFVTKSVFYDWLVF